MVMQEVSKIHLVTVFVNKNSYVEAAYVNKNVADQQCRKIIDEYIKEDIVASVRVEPINLIMNGDVES